MNQASRDRATAASGELHALVLAGGFGRRLEPLTRRLFGEAIPKQFCRFGSNRSLLQQTIDRLAPLVPANRVTVVVDRSQAARAHSQLRAYHGLALVEQPCDRGTAAGVLLPLLELLARDPEATVVLAASDHGIENDRPFLDTLERAAQAVAEDTSRIVLLGAEADAPTTDYGWIVRVGLCDGEQGVDAVERFVEKPAADEAAALFASGRALWNTMVMVARGQTLLALFRERLPELTHGVAALLRVAGSAHAISAADYSQLPAANFSADVLGSARELGALLLPLASGWTDLGTEPRLVEWLERCSAPLSELASTG